MRVSPPGGVAYPTTLGSVRDGPRLKAGVTRWAPKLRRLSQVIPAYWAYGKMAPTKELSVTMENTNQIGIRQKLATARVTMGLIRLGDLIAKFDPNQPRVPAGNPDGGRWTSSGSMRMAGKWNESRRAECEVQYELDMLQCRMTLWNPFCADQARSRMTACMKGDPIPPFFHIGDS